MHTQLSNLIEARKILKSNRFEFNRLCNTTTPLHWHNCDGMCICVASSGIDSGVCIKLSWQYLHVAVIEKEWHWINRHTTTISNDNNDREKHMETKKKSSHIKTIINTHKYYITRSVEVLYIVKKSFDVFIPDVSGYFLKYFVYIFISGIRLYKLFWKDFPCYPKCVRSTSDIFIFSMCFNFIRFLTFVLILFHCFYVKSDSSSMMI